MAGFYTPPVAATVSGVSGSDPGGDSGLVVAASSSALQVDGSERVKAGTDSVELTTGTGQGIKVTSAGAAVFALPSRSVTSTDSPVTVAASECVVFCDTSAGVITVKLPDASEISAGRVFFIADTGNAGTNAITVETLGGTIDGDSSVTIGEDNAALQVISNGANFKIV